MNAGIDISVSLPYRMQFSNNSPSAPIARATTGTNSSPSIVNAMPKIAVT